MQMEFNEHSIYWALHYWISWITRSEMWKCWSQLQWSWILHISCSLAVTIQLVSLIQSHISPQSTNSENEEVNIQKMEFPLLFKICVQPSFNNSAAEELGYDGFWNYFSGMSRFNKSIFGWAGHIHSKSEKVCSTAFSVKKNCGKSA